MAARVLIMEDDPETARLISETLTGEQFEIMTAESARAGLACLADHPVECVLLDYRLQDADGLECLRLIRQRDPGLPIIVITAWGSEEVAVEAMKRGASDYIPKHGKYLLTVAIKVREALGRRRLELTAARCQSELLSTRREVGRLQHELRERYRLDGIIGCSRAIEEALAQAERAARSRATVLLEGETGTGKELFAKAIHYHSARARGPFLAQNCATLPEPLLESELFGHVRGAFTGADRHRRGLFTRADGGTLFLDEVSEMPMSLQTNLLRVVEDGEVRPVGGDDVQHVDVRLIAATNRDLLQVADGKRFSRDLYHRLSVFPIRLPPLRERPDDIGPLAAHFLRRIAEREGKRPSGFDPKTLRILAHYSWPGNVRELQNEIYRLVIRVEDEKRITPDLVSPEVIRAVASPPTNGERPLKEIIDEVKIALIEERSRQYGNNRRETAESLGVSREWLWAMMRKLGLWRPRDGDLDDDER